MLSAIQIAGFLKQAFLQRKSMKQPYFLYNDTNSQKLKVFWKVFGGVWSKISMIKNGYGQSGEGTLKLTAFEEWADGIDKLINWCWYMITKIKSWSKNFWVWMVKNGCGQSGRRAQKWTDGLRLFLHAGKNSWKPKVGSIILRRVWSKMAMTF